jgi:hypothetical protein
MKSGKGNKKDSCYALCEICMKPRNCKHDGHCGKYCEYHAKKSNRITDFGRLSS